MNRVSVARSARQLRGDIEFEIRMIEDGLRETYQITGFGRTDVTQQTLASLRIRLDQVEKLIAAVDDTLERQDVSKGGPRLMV